MDAVTMRKIAKAVRDKYGRKGWFEQDQDVEDLDGAQDPFIYLIHHIHHVAGRAKTGVEEELHHCPLFVQRNGEGEYYTIDDVRAGERVYHVIMMRDGQEAPPNTLYDHLGNGYRIVAKQLANRNVWVVAGLKPGQEVIWSDAQAK